MEKRKLINDVILIAGALVIAIIALLIINRYKAMSTENAMVVIEVNGDEVGRYPLSDDRVVYVESYNGGNNTVTIKDGKVSVSEASCPDKICVKHKRIKYNGETIICLPNRMTVTIVSEGEKTDGKTY